MVVLAGASAATHWVSNVNSSPTTACAPGRLINCTLIVFLLGLVLQEVRVALTSPISGTIPRPMIAIVCAGYEAAWPRLLKPYCVATPRGVGTPEPDVTAAQLAGQGAAGVTGVEGAEAVVCPFAVTLTMIV